MRERVGTCSARTRVRIERGKGLPPHRRRRRHAHPWATIPTRIFARRGDESEGVPRDKALPACHYESIAVRAREALALSFVDKELAPRAIRERLHARKLCGRAYERPPARSSAFGKLFPAAAVASKSRRLKSRPKSRPKSRGVPKVEAIEGSASRFGTNPSSPKAKEELIVAVACHESTQAQGVNLKAERTKACPLSRCTPETPSRPVLRFTCIRPFATRGNEEGSCFVQDPPKQEDKSPPSSLMELKFELDT
jgi:hypothetical protein